MKKDHEHLRVDISPAALDHVRAAVEQYLVGAEFPVGIGTEIQNFANECRARLQHAAAGEPDISETVPGRSTDEDWLA
jgi:hypothetical protein